MLAGSATSNQRVDDVPGDEHALDREAVGVREDPIEQLGAELVEAVAHGVVGRCDGEEIPARRDHPHAVPYGGWDIEDVFERPGVNHDREGALEIRRERVVQVQDP